MSVAVHITTGPLPTKPVPWVCEADPTVGMGAIICFEGIARPTENGRPIVALDYEAYEPMASKMLHRIGEQLIAQHGLIGLCVEHSVGRVAVGECSFRLRIASVHRKEALAAMDQFIDQLKRDVPLWKKAVE